MPWSWQFFFQISKHTTILILWSYYYYRYDMSDKKKKELIYLPEKLDFSRSGHQSLFQFHNPLRQPQSDSSKIRFCGRWHAAEAAETTILSKGSTSWCLHGLWHGRGRREAVMVTCANNKDYCTRGCQIFYGINLLGDFWYGTPMAGGVHGIVIQLEYRIKEVGFYKLLGFLL